MDPVPTPDWELLPDEALLRMRVRALGLRLEGTPLVDRVAQLHAEFASAGLPFAPECYLADEWFSPDGDPVIGIPFYLAHPRLIRLERSLMFEAEGDTPEWCMRLLRHEAGHAVVHAFDLQNARGVQKNFGRFSKDYAPEVYRPQPYSRGFVVNLENWYAQSHPEEDFAETFAVWLNPESAWRERYKGWKALDKLLFMDALMKTLGARPWPVRKGPRMCDASRLALTLDTYYRRKRALWRETDPRFFDADLRLIFSPEGGGEKASRFMRKHQRALLDALSTWTREKKYVVGRLIRLFTERCDELDLRAGGGEEKTLLEITAYLTTLATNYSFTGKFKRSR